MKVKAADIITLRINGISLRVKVEDASKSDSISGKVEHINGSTDLYQVGNVYNFSRDNMEHSH